MTIKEIIDLLVQSHRIGITFHVSPDGDSLGSSMALMHGLNKLGKDAYIISKDKVPEPLMFLPYADMINGASKNVLEGTDSVVVLDCGNFERISAELNFASRTYELINIDHHISNDYYGDLNYVDIKAAAVGEIVFQILEELKVEIDKTIGTCLYTSFVSDTGGFKHSNTTFNTHFISGKLIDTGINFSEIHRLLFQNKKYKRLKLIGKVIEDMYLVHDEKVCIMRLSKSMLESIDIEASDTSDIVSLGVDIDTVEVAVLIKEADEGVKISLRSKSLVDVRKIAEQFGGGGHVKAAGLSLNKSMQEAEAIIINAVEKELI
jgi:bifunctional oligoribonuclease and PAP phosphatase NrnA